MFMIEAENRSNADATNTEIIEENTPVECVFHLWSFLSLLYRILPAANPTARRYHFATSKAIDLTVLNKYSSN